MPIYEYRCNKCGERFDHLVRTERDERELSCPKCQTQKVERQLSVFAAHAAAATPLPRAGGCGRCGDPHGPCSAH